MEIRTILGDEVTAHSVYISLTHAPAVSVIPVPVLSDLQVGDPYRGLSYWFYAQ